MRVLQLPFSVRSPGILAEWRAATVPWRVFIQLCWGSALMVTAPASGVYSQLPGDMMAVHTAQSMSAKAFWPEGLFSHHHANGFASALLGSLLSCQVMSGWPRRCNLPCDPNKSQWHCYLNTSSHSQGPGQMSQDAVSCTSTPALITLKDKSYRHLQRQVDIKVCSQD